MNYVFIEKNIGCLNNFLKNQPNTMINYILGGEHKLIDDIELMSTCAILYIYYL